MTSRYERIGLGDKNVREIGQDTSARKGKQRRTDKTSSGRKFGERRKVSYKRKREKVVDPTRYMQ
jgi:hypothetical protein